MASNPDDKTYVEYLEEEISQDSLAPFRTLISLAENMGEDMYDFHDMMKIVLEKVERNIGELFELVNAQIGAIQIQATKPGEFVDFEDKRYGKVNRVERFRAFLVPIKKKD